MAFILNVNYAETKQAKSIDKQISKNFKRYNGLGAVKIKRRSEAIKEHGALKMQFRTYYTFTHRVIHRNWG